MQVKELSFDEFLGSQSMWESALEKSLDNNVFETWEWLSAWWRHYRGTRRFFLVAAVEGEKLLAAAPLMFTNYRLLGLSIKRVEFLTNPAADYHTFLLTEKKPELVKLILEHVKKEAEDWDLIELSDVPQDSETGKILLSAMLIDKKETKQKIKY